MNIRRAMVLALLWSCRSSAPTPPPATPIAQNLFPDAPAEDAAADVVAAPPAPSLAAHGTPVALPGTIGRIEFLGTAEQAMVARFVSGTNNTTRAVDDWPVGVRVLAGAAHPHGTSVLLLVETIAAFQRPAGLRSVIYLVTGQGSEPSWSVESIPLATQRTARTINDAAGLAGLFASLEREPPSDEFCTALTRALRAPNMARTVTHPDGLDVFVAWGDGLITYRETLTPTALAAPANAAVVTAIRERARLNCSTTLLEATEPTRSPRVRSVFVRATDATPTQTPPSAISVVAPQPPNEQVQAFLRARFTNAEVVGSAPLTPTGGSITIVTTDTLYTNLAVLEEAGTIRTVRFDGNVNVGERRITAVRFGDVNGDQRADPIIEVRDPTPAQPTQEASRPFAHRGVHFVPAPGFANALSYDLGSLLALFNADTLDHAVSSLGSVPWDSVTAQQACPLVQATRTLATVRRFASSSMRVLHYGEPSAFGLNPQLLPLTGFSETRSYVSGVVPCSNLTCDRRMVCVGHYNDDGPGGTAYWFTRENNALRLAAFAVYTGE